MKDWDYPKIAKYLLLAMLTLELSTYIYLTISNSHCQKAFLLSSYLLTTSLVTFIACSLAIPLKFYFHHWIIFFTFQVLAITFRLGAVIWIVVLDS